MKKLFALIPILFLSFQSYAQTVGDIRFPISGSLNENIVHAFDGSSCTPSIGFDIGPRGRIKFLKDLGNGNYLIDVTRNNVNSNNGLADFANVNGKYCISKDDYDSFFDKKKWSNSRPVYGFLAVPFKLRFNPTTVAPGGELGGFYGWFIKDSSWILAPHAGLTFISLNDINANTPENKTGFTFGMALINDVSDNFQVGIISGVDIFDGVDDWVYGYSPWLSVQFGFKFTKQ